MSLRLILALSLAIGGLSFLSACGGTDDEQRFVEVAFTPTPTPEPIPKECGDGEIDPGEQCDTGASNPNAGCSGGTSCVCCTCLPDDGTLGDRVYAIARPGSQLQNNILSCQDATMNPWSVASITLRAGRPDPTLPGEESCSATLQLAEDVVFGFKQPIGVGCVKLFAEGSTGSIDCDGGTAHDVSFTQNSNGLAAADPPVIETGLGDPGLAGPGAATLVLARAVLLNVQGNATIDVCDGLDYENPANNPGIIPDQVTDSMLAFTTRAGTSTVLNPLVFGAPSPNPISCTTVGQNFTCPTWSEPQSVGIILAPVTALNQLDGGVDTANMLVVNDK